MRYLLALTNFAKTQLLPWLFVCYWLLVIFTWTFVQAISNKLTNVGKKWRN